MTLPYRMDPTALTRRIDELEAELARRTREQARRDAENEALRAENRRLRSGERGLGSNVRRLLERRASPPFDLGALALGLMTLAGIAVAVAGLVSLWSVASPGRWSLLIVGVGAVRLRYAIDRR